MLAAARFIKGEDCALLEQEFAAYCGVAHACGVANGTDALILALRAYGVGPGDEVVTVANTFIATGEAILLNGARPVFVDVDPDDLHDGPGQARGGHHAPHEGDPPRPPLRPSGGHGRHLARSPRATACRCSRTPPRPTAPRWAGGARAPWATPPASASIPGKNLGAYGDAGHGHVGRRRVHRPRAPASRTTAAGRDKYDNVVLGTNSRLDTLQAAVLRVKLRHLDAWDDGAARARRGLRRGPGGRPGPRRRRGSARARAPPGTSTRCGAAERDAAAGAPQGAGHRHRRALPAPDPPAARDGVRRADRPATCRSRSACRREVLSLPLYPELPLETVRRIAREVREALG